MAEVTSISLEKPKTNFESGSIVNNLALCDREKRKAGYVSTASDLMEIHAPPGSLKDMLLSIPPSD